MFQSNFRVTQLLWNSQEMFFFTLLSRASCKHSHLQMLLVLEYSRSTLETGQVSTSQDNAYAAIGNIIVTIFAQYMLVK